MTRPVRARRSLRVRLVVIIAAALAVVTLVIGAATVFAVRGSLVGRLDAQLTAAADRSTSNARDTGGTGGGDRSGGAPSGTDFLLAPGQAAGTLGARLLDGTVGSAAVLADDGSLQQLTTSQAAALLAVPVDGQPTTVSVGSHGDYRVVATRGPDPGSGDVLVTGLPLADVDRTTVRLVAVEGGMAVAAIVAAVAVSLLLVRRTLRPLARVASTADRVSRLPLAEGDVAIHERIGARDVDDATEVGQVAGSVNRLLDHVDHALSVRHDSEQTLRRFVADASHELRTPLAVIRGYADLLGRGGHDPADAAGAVTRVQAEATRMTALVDDLLMLARLDAGRELARDDVDLTAVVLDAVTDAAAAGPHHRWVPELPPEPVEVVGDRDALHQVVTNLLANARVHTPPGTSVRATVRPDPGAAAVELVVHDDGPGVPAERQSDVFERFSRGAVSRDRSSGSTGLGLAIVRAIVEAHGGTVALSSVPGATSFVVRLPTR